MMENKQALDMVKQMEEELMEMMDSERYKMDIKHLGGGQYQLTKDGQACVMDQESEFRLRVFLNSFSLLTEKHKQMKNGGEE